jgi:hypothetical protein
MAVAGRRGCSVGRVGTSGVGHTGARVPREGGRVGAVGRWTRRVRGAAVAAWRGGRGGAWGTSAWWARGHVGTAAKWAGGHGGQVGRWARRPSGQVGTEAAVVAWVLLAHARHIATWPPSHVSRSHLSRSVPRSRRRPIDRTPLGHVVMWARHYAATSGVPPRRALGASSMAPPGHVGHLATPPPEARRAYRHGGQDVGWSHPAPAGSSAFAVGRLWVRSGGVGRGVSGGSRPTRVRTRAGSRRWTRRRRVRP